MAGLQQPFKHGQLVGRRLFADVAGGKPQTLKLFKYAAFLFLFFRRFSLLFGFFLFSPLGCFPCFGDISPRNGVARRRKRVNGNWNGKKKSYPKNKVELAPNESKDRLSSHENPATKPQG